MECDIWLGLGDWYVMIPFNLLMRWSQVLSVPLELFYFVCQNPGFHISGNASINSSHEATAISHCSKPEFLGKSPSPQNLYFFKWHFPFPKLPFHISSSLYSLLQCKENVWRKVIPQKIIRRKGGIHFPTSFTPTSWTSLRFWSGWSLLLCSPSFPAGYKIRICVFGEDNSITILSTWLMSMSRNETLISFFMMQRFRIYSFLKFHAGWACEACEYFPLPSVSSSPFPFRQQDGIDSVCQVTAIFSFVSHRSFSFPC